MTFPLFCSLALCLNTDVISVLLHESQMNLLVPLIERFHWLAFSGTEKQAVAYDYARRLAYGTAECEVSLHNFYAFDVFGMLLKIEINYSCCVASKTRFFYACNHKHFQLLDDLAVMSKKLPAK